MKRMKEDLHPLLDQVVVKLVAALIVQLCLFVLNPCRPIFVLAGGRC